MQAINSVKGEIHNVLTALRLTSYHNKANGYINEGQMSLIRGLKFLHESFSNHVDVDELDTCALVMPFLDVVVSKLADIQVSIMAMRAIHNFLMYGYINAQTSSRPQDAVRIIVTHVVNREEYTEDRDEEEIACMCTLEVLLQCLVSSLGPLLMDEHICVMAQKCTEIRNKRGASRLLRKLAENTLTQIVLVVFGRLNPETGAGGNVIIAESSSSSSSSSSSLDQQQSLVASPDLGRSTSSSGFTALRTLSTRPAQLTTGEGKQQQQQEQQQQQGRYGVNAMVDLLHFVARLIDPDPDRNSEKDRCFGLSLLRTVWETTGPHISEFPRLVQVIQDEICKYVLQNSQTHNVYIFSLTLRMVFDLFVVVKQHLKMELEVFFTSIHLRVGNSSASSFGQKELVLESLKEFCIEPSLIAGLYRNYDCEVGSTNLFEDLCRFLSTHASPQGHLRPNRLNILALECLLAVVDSIAKRFCGRTHGLHHRTLSSSSLFASGQQDKKLSRPRMGSSHQSQESYLRMSPEEEQAVLQSRANKKNLTLAAARFNAEGSKSFPYLCSLSILPDPVRATSVVDFFLETPGLDGSKVGEFLGGNKELNVSVLKEFVDRFDFAVQGEVLLGVPRTDVLSLDDALRAFLHHFQLPVEAQQIERVLEQFSRVYFRYCTSCGTHTFADEDATFLLCYSVIMLNTDAHNKNVYRKMTKEEFMRNNRLCNGGMDFPEEYMSNLYDAIVHNEIKLSAKLAERYHDGENGDADELTGGERENAILTDKKWNYLKHRSRTRGGKFEVKVPQKSGKEMFLLVWQSSIHLFIFYIEQKQLALLNHASRLNIRDKIVKGFHDFCNVCDEYDLTEIFNMMMISLCSSLHEALEDIKAEEDGPVVGYARDPCAEALVELVLRITVDTGEELLREGWSNVLSVLQTFRVIGFLPPSLLELEDFRNDKGNAMESLGSLKSDVYRSGGEKDGIGSKTLGLVSSALSYLWVSPAVDTDSESPMPEHDGAGKSTADMHAEGIARLRALPFERVMVTQPKKSALAAAHLLKALLRASSSPAQHAAIRRTGQDKPYHENDAVFALELLFKFVVGNQHLWTTSSSSSSAEEQQLQQKQEQKDAKQSSMTPAAPQRRSSVETAKKPRAAVNPLLAMEQHLSDAIQTLKDDQPATFYVERLVVNVLRFSQHMLTVDEHSVLAATRLLSLLLQLPKSLFDAFASRIAAGLLLFVQTHGHFVRSSGQWQVVLDVALRLRLHRDTSVLRKTFEALKAIVEFHTSPCSFQPVMRALYTFCLPCVEVDDAWHPIQPAVLLGLMLECHEHLVGVRFDSEEESKIASSSSGWSRDALWLESVKTFCDVCAGVQLGPQARRQAADALQQALLGSQVSTVTFAKAADVWSVCFEAVLLPFLSSARATNTQRGRQLAASGDSSLLALIDTHARLSSVVLQTFLRNADILAQLSTFSMFWLDLLGKMEAFMNWQTDLQEGERKNEELIHTAQERLLTHLVQSIKNAILVMTQAGLFSSSVAPGGYKGQNLWSLTWTLVSSFSAGKVICKELEELRPSSSSSSSSNVEDSSESTSTTTITTTPSDNQALEKTAEEETSSGLQEQGDNDKPESIVILQPQANHEINHQR